MAQLSQQISYAILLLAFGITAWFLARKAIANREAALESAAPKIAGDDEMEGSAKDPSQFDEPDDDALDEMADLLGEDEEPVEEEGDEETDSEVDE